MEAHRGCGRAPTAPPAVGLSTRDGALGEPWGLVVVGWVSLHLP